jgi:hypothetical protein
MLCRRQVQSLRSPELRYLAAGPCTGSFWDSDAFLQFCFLDDNSFINNHPPDLKLVSSKTLMTRRAIFYNLH